jgi:hypothetical protein
MDDQLNPTTTNFTLRFRIDADTRLPIALALGLISQVGTIETNYGKRPVQFVSMDTNRPDHRTIEVAIHIEMN